jgi:hypothetical protein
VATQDPSLAAGLVVGDKRKRVAKFHGETIESARHMIEAMGLNHPSELRPWHVFKRISPLEVKHYGEIFPSLEPGALLKKTVPANYRNAFEAATADSFAHANETKSRARRFPRKAA